MNTLFYHNVFDTYPNLEGVSHINRYDTRAIILAGPGDTVAINRASAPQLENIRQHHEIVGIPLPAIEFVSGPHEVSALFADSMRFSPFKYDEKAHAIVPNQRQLRATRHFDNKCTIAHTATQFGVPVPPETTCYQQGADALGHGRDFTYPLIVKAASGASDQGNVRVHEPDQFDAAIVAVGLTSELLVQRLLPGSDYSLLYYVHQNGELRKQTATRQYTPYGAHEGNDSVALPDAVWNIFEPLARAIAIAGFRGPFGLDVFQTECGAWAAFEANARNTAATYFGTAARRLGFPDWVARNIHDCTPDFSINQVTDLLYSPVRGHGIVITNWAFPKTSVVALGPDQEKQIRTFAKRVGGHVP